MATVLLCTETFFSVAEREAKRTGLPKLPRIAMPHDLLGLDDGQRHQLAARLVGEALAALTGESAPRGKPSR